MAVENDVHIVGVSSQVAAHKTLVPGLLEALKSEGGDDILVVVGGIIPPGDYEFLYNAGAAGVVQVQAKRNIRRDGGLAAARICAEYSGGRLAEGQADN